MLKKFLTIIFMLLLLTVPLYAEGSKFAPLSEEFLDWRNDPSRNGERPSPVDRSYLSKSSKKFLRSSLKDGETILPVTYDLRNYGRVPEIKNQGIYETCWTFASLGSMESNYLTQNLSFLETSPDFSELHMAWFLYADSNPENNYFVVPLNVQGVNIPEEYYVLGQGGNYYMAMAYLARMSGPVDESLLPYEKAPSMDVMPKNATDYHPISLRVHEAELIGMLSPYFDAETREDIKNVIKKHIMTNGAVQASYFSQGSMYSNSSGFTTYFNNNGTKTGHAVQIIGWDDNFSALNFNNNDPDLIPSSKGAWIVKNSWGSNWGDEGYFYMSYEQYLGNIASYIVKENETGIKHYGHDALGWCADVQGKWQANIFRSERANEIIKEISFYTTDDNVNCDFYVFDLGTVLPSSPLPSDINTPLFVSKDILVETAGYHTIILEKAVPIEEGHYFSIVAKMNMASGYEYPIAIEAEIEEYSYPAVYARESWISNNTGEILTDSMEWTDGKNFYVPLNVCLKVFTVPAMTIDEEKFPDENFRAYILNTLDLDKDEYLSENEIAKATVINLNGLGIKDLTGIKFFTALKTLDCSENKLTSFDITGLENLSELICNSQDVDITAKIRQTFSTGDYKYKTDLSTLSLTLENIVNVTASNTESYFDKENLIAYFKEIPTEIIYWYDVNFEDVLMSVYVKISEEFEPVTPSEVPVEDVIESLRYEVKDETNLASYIEAMRFYGVEKVTALKIPTYITNVSGIEKFTGLQSLDLNANSSITSLNLSGSKIEYVEATACDELQEIVLKNCVNLFSLDVGNSPKVVSIDVENCVNLETLSFPFCSVNNFNIAGCSALKVLECENNSLAELNLESFDKIVEVSCASQDITGWSFGSEINFADYVSHPEKISNVKAFDKDDKEISVSSAFFTSDTNAVTTFASIPAKISYDYETGFKDLKMDVTVTNSKTEENKNLSSSSSGSCSTGINIFSAAIILFALIKRK